MEIDARTEEAFERYYEGGFRTGNPYWLYLGFFSMIATGVLAGMILGWSLKLDAEKLVPGVFVPNETQYLFVGGLEIEVKAIEYAALFGAFVVLGVCAVMVGK